MPGRDLFNASNNCEYWKENLNIDTICIMRSRKETAQKPAILLPVEWIFEKALSVVSDRTERANQKRKILIFHSSILKKFFKSLPKNGNQLIKSFSQFYSTLWSYNFNFKARKFEHSFNRLLLFLFFCFFPAFYQPTLYYPPKYAFFAKYPYFEVIISLGRTNIE